MRLIRLIIGLVPALAKEQVPIRSTNSLKVSGRNPFFFCNDQNPYTLQIDHIHLTPASPADWQPGHNITLEIDGHNQQIIEDGAIVEITIMRRDSDTVWRQLISGQHDLCTGLKDIFGESCPIRSGVSTEARNFTLPSETLRGTYYLVVDAHSKFAERITCIQATVVI